jgi:hypothetical protein
MVFRYLSTPTGNAAAHSSLSAECASILWKIGQPEVEAQDICVQSEAVTNCANNNHPTGLWSQHIYIYVYNIYTYIYINLLQGRGKFLCPIKKNVRDTHSHANDFFSCDMLSLFVSQ